MCKFLRECFAVCLSGNHRDLERVSAVMKVNARICACQTSDRVLESCNCHSRQEEKICNLFFFFLRTHCFLINKSCFPTTFEMVSESINQFHVVISSGMVPQFAASIRWA